jgi:hypothetical protein
VISKCVLFIKILYNKQNPAPRLVDFSQTRFHVVQTAADLENELNRGSKGGRAKSPRPAVKATVKTAVRGRRGSNISARGRSNSESPESNSGSAPKRRGSIRQDYAEYYGDGSRSGSARSPGSPRGLAGRTGAGGGGQAAWNYGKPEQPKKSEEELEREKFIKWSDIER